MSTTVTETVKENLSTDSSRVATFEPEEWQPPFTVERRGDAVAVLWLDLPDKDVNVLRPDLAEPLAEALEELADDGGIEAVVLASGKPESFVVGADVELLRRIGSEEEGFELSRRAQEMMDRLEAFQKPIVAAIHGDCLGGGLELALACDERVASDAEATRLGLPEVKLGLLPGAGGTQRLPELIGLEAAMKLILTGRRLPAGRARNLGLVDDVAHPAIVVEVAAKRARELAGGRSRAGGKSRDLKQLLLEDNPLGRRLLLSQSENKTRDKVGDHMPAPFEAIEVVRRGLEDGREHGLRAEAAAFGRLAVSPQAEALIDLFLWRRELEKETGLEAFDLSEDRAAEIEAERVEKVAVLGAGLMGAGIAGVTSKDAGLPVRLKDVDHRPLLAGLRSLRRDLDREVDQGRLGKPERDRILARVCPTTDYTGFGRAGVVIEAVVEDLEVKHDVLAEVEEHAPEAIFASNTSSLPIARIAEGAARPQRVLGMHYFSPVDKVPLLEVVLGEKTAPEAAATCVELGKRQGKTVIVVRDGTGFYTSRILGPYLGEALRILCEGAPVDHVDGALTDFGFPVGPLKLLDEVGIDVGDKIAAILHDAFGERMAPAPAQEALAEDDRRGRKNGRGFYRYREKDDGWERSGGADSSIYRLLGVDPEEGAVESQEIVRRCVLGMANEAVRCLDEGIVRSVRDADVGAVFGLGFPPFLGGPLRWLDRRGIRDAVAELEELAADFGPRFAPAGRLLIMAADGKSFHPAG